VAYLRGILALAFLVLAFPALAEEEILNYDAKVVVTTDGALTVTETIQVRAEGNEIRRGIYRDFPTKYKLPNGTSVSTTFDVVKVTMNGGSVNWTTEHISNGTRVRIGSADVFLNPGVYTYEIRYRTERQLYFGEGFDELYWNVTGNDWGFPINNVRATVMVPDGAVIEDTRAFTGYQGDTGADFTSRRDGDRRVIFETTSRLYPRQGLTVVVTWPAGLVTRPTAADLAGNFLTDNLSVIVGYLGVLLVGFYFYVTWRRVGKDPDTGPVIARYNPPLGLSPAAAGFVIGRDYKMSQFTAAIVNMAVKGAIKIEELGKREFRLTKTGAGSGLSPGETEIFRSLLGIGTSIITKQSNHSDFRRAQKAHEKILEQNHENIHFIRNRKPFWIGAGISIFAAFLAVFLDFGLGNYEVIFLPILIGFYGIFFFVLGKGLKSRMAAGGCARAPIFIAFGFLIFHFMGMAGALFLDNFMFAVPFILIVGLNVLFLNLLEKPTLEGAQLVAEIKGFKKYLSMAEKERLEFHTGTITPEKFEAYLPYAIALGVENKWGEAFEAEMVKLGQDPAQYQPTWYYGGRYYGFSGNSNFGSAFGGAFAGAVASASAPPSSSGGSGGGGFSGGGGGGGGGGGW